MSGGRGLSESEGGQMRGTLAVLLGCIIFFAFGLYGQGDALGAEDAPASLILSTNTGVSEEPGGSQGAVPRTGTGVASQNAEAGQTVESADSSALSGQPAPGVPLAVPGVPAAATMPVSVGGNDNQPAEKTGATQDAVVADVVAGHVQHVSGEVQATDKAGRIRTLRKDDAIYEGDTVASAKAASAQIAMEDGGSITLRPETRLKFDSFKFNGKEDGAERSFFSLLQGGFHAVTGLIGTTNKQSYRISTPVATIGVLGTDHEIVYLPEDMLGAVAGVYDKVNAGATVLTTNVGSVRVGSNQMGYAGGMYQLPRIQPIILSLFTDYTAPGPDSTAGSATQAADTALPPAVPQPPSAVASATDATGQLTQASIVAPANVVGTIGEAQKNGEVKYSDGEAQKNGEVKYRDAAKKVVPGEEIGSLRGFKFGLAPIRWGGDLSETLSRRNHSDGASTTQNMQRVNLRAASYIWQPWLARVRGNIGLVRSKDTVNTSGTTSDSSYTSLVGGAGLSLFPLSRFPFEASLRSDDSRTNYALSPALGVVYRSVDLRQSYRPLSGTSYSVATYGRSVTSTQNFDTKLGTDVVNTRWTLRHDYQPLNSTSRYGVGYDRNVWNTAEGGGNASWGLQGNFSTSFDKQSFGVDARRSDSFYSLNGSDLSSSGIVMRHGYRPSGLLTVSSSASVDQANMSSNNSYNTRYLQANSVTSWQPDQDLPLYVNGSVRIYDSSHERLDAVNTIYSSQNQVVSLGARYAHTRNLSYALDGSIANSKSSTNSSVEGTNYSNRAVTENGSVTYTADIIKFGDASYNRNANAAIGFQSNTAFASNRIVSGGAGHGLGVPYLLDGGASLDFNIGESLIARNDRNLGQNRTLTHTGGVSWRPVQRGTLSGSVTASVNDMRNVGGDEKIHYQGVSLGVNALSQASANSTLTAGASLQWTANRLAGHYSSSGHAHAEYRHARAFDVKGLRYELMFNMNTLQSRNDDPQVAPSTTTSSSLDQYLDYRIGRANIRLSLGLARYGNARSRSIMLHLGRSFGSL